MENQLIDLTPFCAAGDYPRPYLNNPFSFDAYTAATNGHIAILVDRREETPVLDNDKAISAIRNILYLLTQKRGTETGTLRLAELEPELTDCKLCEGSGLTYVCPECEGKAEIQLASNFSDYEAECKTCDGSGTVLECEIQSLRMRHSRHPLVNKAPNRCQSCAGSGKQPKEEKYIVGDTSLGTFYLLLLKTLPNATIYAFDKTDPALIEFDGGLGILMPRRD
jgi:hypothetical protein